MNKKLSTNSYLGFINGYLGSLSDIDGRQREFSVSFSMIQSENISIESELKLAYDFMEDIEIIKDIKYPNECCFTHFLEKLLLIKPFRGLYEISNDVYIPDNVIEVYRDYIIFHLEDYLDFALEEEENRLALYDSTMRLFLIKYRNHRNNSISYFLTIQKEVKNIKQFISFYSKAYVEKDFSTFFNEIIEWKKNKIKCIK